MIFTPEDHTFAICAYKESPFLRECIHSLLAQTVKTNLIITTSTDNQYIRSIAEEYAIPLFVTSDARGIANDWNFAYHSSNTPLVTLAHQDDCYTPDYTADMLTQLNHSKYPLIYFTGYNELRNGQTVSRGPMLFVKRLMLLPLKFKPLQGLRFFKRLSLAFGNPVACWSVAYVKKHLPETVFISNFRSNLDWEEWEKLTHKKGEFVYSARRLTLHRVHEDSETSITIRTDNIRGQEDFAMFLKFWPRWFAKFLMRFYIKAEKYNNVK